MKGSLLNQYRGYRAPTRIKFGLNHMSYCKFVRIRLQFQDLCLKENHLQKFLNPFPLLGRYVHQNGITTPSLRREAVFCQLAFYPLRICLWFVNLVYGYHNRHTGYSGMVDSFNGLRHYPIISSHYQNNQISYLCPPRTHSRECLMARRIKKYDLPFF